jgi:Mg2+ and Co2+ transporter CorA
MKPNNNTLSETQINTVHQPETTPKSTIEQKIENTIKNQISTLKNELQSQNQQLINEIKNEIATISEKIGQDIKHLHAKIVKLEETDKSTKEHIRKISSVTLWIIQNLQRIIPPGKSTVTAMETMVEIMAQNGQSNTEQWNKEINKAKQRIAETQNTSQNLQI